MQKMKIGEIPDQLHGWPMTRREDVTYIREFTRISNNFIDLCIELNPFSCPYVLRFGLILHHKKRRPAHRKHGSDMGGKPAWIDEHPTIVPDKGRHPHFGYVARRFITLYRRRHQDGPRRRKQPVPFRLEHSKVIVSHNILVSGGPPLFRWANLNPLQSLSCDGGATPVSA